MKNECDYGCELKVHDRIFSFFCKKREKGRVVIRLEKLYVHFLYRYVYFRKYPCVFVLHSTDFCMSFDSCNDSLDFPYLSFPYPLFLLINRN